VAGEVAIGSLIVSYLMQLACSVYRRIWPGARLLYCGAMVGRFIGAWLLRLSRRKVLACRAATVIVL